MLGRLLQGLRDRGYVEGRNLVIEQRYAAGRREALPHWANGFFINWSFEPGKGHGFEMNLALIGMALAVLVGGAGALSIDRWLRPGDMASGPCSSRRISQSPRSTSCATRTGLQHVLLGSVAENVVRLPPCPVLAVKHRGAPG